LKIDILSDLGMVCYRAHSFKQFPPCVWFMENVMKCCFLLDLLCDRQVYSMYQMTSYMER